MKNIIAMTEQLTSEERAELGEHIKSRYGVIPARMDIPVWWVGVGVVVALAFVLGVTVGGAI